MSILSPWTPPLASTAFTVVRVRLKLLVPSPRPAVTSPAMVLERKLIESYANTHGLELVQILEESQSAAKSGREQFKHLIHLVESGEVQVILAEKTDRLYRNISDYSLLDFEKIGCEIHLIKENEVLSNRSRSHQKFIHGIKVLMAKNYTDNLSEEVKKGTKEKCEQGWWPGLFGKLQTQSDSKVGASGYNS